MPRGKHRRIAAFSVALALAAGGIWVVTHEVDESTVRIAATRTDVRRHHADGQAEREPVSVRKPATTHGPRGNTRVAQTAAVADPPPVANAPSAPRSPPPTTSPPSTASTASPPPITPYVAAALPTPTPPPADPYAPGPLTQIATLRIPRIGVAVPVYEGVTLTVIDRGPGHWPGTAMPGAPGNVVIGGHRVSHTHPFLDLDQLRAGDQMTFDMPNGTHATYLVSSLEVVPPTALYIVHQTNARTVTLFTCHPKGSAAQRLVVHGTLA